MKPSFDLFFFAINYLFLFLIIVFLVLGLRALFLLCKALSIYIKKNSI